MYENHDEYDINPIKIHISKVCNKRVMPIFIGWLMDENINLFIIIKITEKICLIQRVV